MSNNIMTLQPPLPQLSVCIRSCLSDRGSRIGLLRRPAHERRQGPEHDLNVTPQRPVVDVVVVEGDSILDRRIAAQAVDLSPSRQPAGNAKPIVVPEKTVGEVLHEIWPLR